MKLLDFTLKSVITEIGLINQTFFGSKAYKISSIFENHFFYPLQLFRFDYMIAQS
jgi:hypothetical protein